MEENTDAQLQYALARMEERDARARQLAALDGLNAARSKPFDSTNLGPFHAAIDALDAAWLDWKICGRLRHGAMAALPEDTMDEPAIPMGNAPVRIVSTLRPAAARAA